MTYKPKEFEEVRKVVSEFTGLRTARLKTLWLLTQNLNKQNIQGDIVECGVRDGGSAAILAAAMGNRKIWLYDSFQGLPQTVHKDGERAKQEIGKAVGSIGKVHEAMRRVGVDQDRCVIVEGWFENTFRNEKALPNKVALLHCDADFYKPTLLTLRTFYHRIPRGGYVVLDDFAGWEGQRIAFYEFCEQIGERPLVERVEERQLWWRKGKEHNRFDNEPVYYNEWQML